MRTTQQMRDAWGPPCRADVMVPRLFVHGVTIEYHRATQQAWSALAYALLASEYHVRPGETGAYNCLAGETLVMTPDGTKQISELAESGRARILTRTPARGNGGPGRWADAEVRCFGVDRLHRVVLSRGGVRREVFATDSHRWLLDMEDRADQERTTATLRKGHRLASVYPQRKASRTIPSAVGIAHGIVFGDGSKTEHEARVLLCGEKNAPLLRFFPQPRTTQSVHGVMVHGLPRSWKNLPSADEGASYIYGFLAGYFAADGRVRRDGVMELYCKDAGTLERVKVLCAGVGIQTGGVRSFVRQGYGAERTGLCSLGIFPASVEEDFLLIPEHRARFLAAPKVKQMARWKVEAVEPTDRVEPVYCAVVPGTECFALAENLLTGNCRRITGGSGHSLHSYGIALDINPTTNPYAGTLITDMPRPMLRAVQAIRINGGIPLFRWGGDWDWRSDTDHSSYDAMHFELNVSPAELALGVDWNTVPMPALNPARPELWPVCQRGDRHPVVRKLQQLLGLSADGIFGAATEGNVRRFQASRRIKADGQVGAGTWTALLAGLPADPLISPAKLSAAAAP